MDLAKLFYIGGFGLIVLSMPTALVFMAWWTRDRQAAPAKAQPIEAAHAAELPPLRQAA